MIFWAQNVPIPPKHMLAVTLIFVLHNLVLRLKEIIFMVTNTLLTENMHDVILDKIIENYSTF